MSHCAFGKTVTMEFDAAVDKVTQALAAEPSIGALLPCNVVVRVDAGGHTQVEFMDPEAVLRLVDHPGVARLAGEVRQRLVRVMESP